MSVCAGPTDQPAALAAGTPHQGRLTLGDTHAFACDLDMTCWAKMWPQRQVVGENVPLPKPLGDKGQVESTAQGGLAPGTAGWPGVAKHQLRRGEGTCKLGFLVCHTVVSALGVRAERCWTQDIPHQCWPLSWSQQWHPTS